ncbi:Esa1p-associated factor [Dispira simplex]|nr:Esa1p-associated factor [Dispira simplex]
MPAKSVHIWFQNRRAKKNLELRKAGKPVPPRYPSLHNFKRFLSLPNTHIFYMGPNSTPAASAQSPNHAANPTTTFETKSAPMTTSCQCNHTTSPLPLPPSPPSTGFPSPLATERPYTSEGYGSPHYFTALPSPQSDYTAGPSCEPSPLPSPLPSPHLIPHEGTLPTETDGDLCCEESTTTTSPSTENWTGEASDEDEEGPHYLIHYKGWKQTWDEWVPETRVRKYDAENLEKQKQLKDMYSTKKKASSAQREKSTTSSTVSPSDRGRKRPRDLAGEKDEEYVKRPEIRIPIPSELKSLLVDDWEHITKDHQLVPLPRRPSVSEILQRYRDSKTEESAGKKRPGHDRYAEDILDEFIEGLKLYFNKALGNVLLYLFERYQYANILKQHPDKEMCDIYGAEHLLRLFVQLPSLITHAHMDSEGLSILKEHLQDLLKFIQQHSNAFFVTDYDNASPGYMSVVRNS